MRKTGLDHFLTNMIKNDHINYLITDAPLPFQSGFLYAATPLSVLYDATPVAAREIIAF